MRTKLISIGDIEAIITRIGLDSLLDELVARLESAFAKLDLTTALIPARSGINYQNPDLGLLEWMPASVNQGRASLKIVGYHPSNPQKRNLPTILSSIGIFDTKTGHMECLLDGTFTTALRTGAMTAVASKRMALQTNNMVLGIVGCGAQAVTQIHALSRHFQISRIIAYDTAPDAAESLEQRISFTHLNVQTVDATGLASLLEDSNIICTCTSAAPGSGPLFPDFNNQPGLHINAVGSDFPTKIELPIDLLKRSFVCPDFLEQAKAEGECQQLEAEDIGADLAEVLKSTTLQESAKRGLSVFDSTGHAYADYVTGLMMLDYATELNLGLDIQMESITPDPKDPYSFLDKSSLPRSSGAKVTQAGS